MLTTTTILLLLAQEPAKPAPPAPAAQAKEEFPRWSVHGVLATDVSAIASDTRNSIKEEGITGEYTLGGSLHASKGLRLNLKACYGCHGVELQDAHADLDLTSAFTFRAGRLPVPFGGLSQRTSHDQMESSSRPLPYIMGHMVQGARFNQGVVPAPIVDNGFQMTWSAWMSDSSRFTLEAAAVRGFVGSTPDLQFDLSRDFEDDNGEPAGSTRATLVLGAVTLGASAMGGHYDVDNELSYLVGGVHAELHLGALNLRAEGLSRKNEFDDLSGSQDSFTKTGYAVQADLELDPQWKVFGMVDGLRVEGIYLGNAGPQASPVGATDDSNSITRAVFGLVHALKPGFLLKGSAEFWDMSDFDDSWVFHFAAVASF